MTTPLLMNEAEIHALTQSMAGNGLMAESIAQQRVSVEAFMALPLEVPGHGEAGGPEHTRHKQNYQYMNVAGRLFLITGEQKYGQFVTDLLTIYADRYLGFDFHVQKNTNPTGRLFHQILNEHCWLLFSSLAYSCVSASMTQAQRDHIVSNLFEPMLEMFTVKYRHDFDRIHNHGIWAVAAVGIAGLAIGQRHYLEMSVYGCDADGTGGFLAQLDQLFAPSGYYLEGPYYHRYAIRPTCLFAEILHRHWPEIDILNYKNQVIKHSIKALLSTAYPDGVFPALNDASRTMSIRDEGVKVAVSLYAHHYQCDDNIVAMAQLQQGVWIHACGLTLSQQHAKASAQGPIGVPNWPSCSLSEGPQGDRGAQGFLRAKTAAGQVSQLVMNYGQHGMGHGHFDTLGVSFFSLGQEVLTEYGFGRWVNVETKFGGRYLPENQGYARQSIAHNLVTVDETSQNHADATQADTRHGVEHFFADVNDQLQAMSAFADQHVDGVNMQRSAFLIDLPELAAPMYLDLFALQSEQSHQYDYSHYYQGQIVRTHQAIEANRSLLPLGEDNGYQHLWKLGQARADDGALVSWLQGQHYYTWLGKCSSAQSELVMTRTGANDPQMNLRSEPGFVLRTQGDNCLFASVLESHGYFNEAYEKSEQARGQVEQLDILHSDLEASIVQVTTQAHQVTVMISHRRDADPLQPFTIEVSGQSYAWQGPYQVDIQARPKAQD